MVARPEGEQAGGERGILFREILKIPVLMVKTNPNHGGLELIYSVSRSLPPQCCGGLSATTV